MQLTFIVTKDLSLTSEKKLLSVSIQYVLRRIRAIEKINRNVTADNWFTCIGARATEKRYNFSKNNSKNKMEIPYNLLPKKYREVNNSYYRFF